MRYTRPMTDDYNNATWSTCHNCGKTERRTRMEQRHGMLVCTDCQDSFDVDRLRKENAKLRGWLREAVDCDEAPNAEWAERIRKALEKTDD